MLIKLIAVGQKMPEWVENAYSDYKKRFPNHIKLELKEIALNKRPKNGEASALIKKETDQIIAALPKDAHIITLDVPGKHWSTENLSQQFEYWQTLGKPICFIIGGPEGLSETLREKAHQSWSLSKLTYPHPLVRIIWIEQLYRALTIIQGHPYHK